MNKRLFFPDQRANQHKHQVPRWYALEMTDVIRFASWNGKHPQTRLPASCPHNIRSQRQMFSAEQDWAGVRSRGDSRSISTQEEVAVQSLKGHPSLSPLS
jgi:hypothetical protein